MKGMVFKKEIWDVLRNVKDYMEITFRPIVEGYGLTMMQTRILLEIGQYEHPTVGCLCNGIGLTSGNASSMCKKLESFGLIKRFRDPKDERFVELSLTEKGKETIRRIEEALDEKYGKFLESRKEEEFQELISGIKKLSAFIKEMSTLK